MEAGKLRHRVTIERPTGTPNELGEQEIGWTVVRTVWAWVRPLTAREATVAGQVRLEATHVVVLRYAADLTADCRFKFEGRTLNIVGIVDVDGRKREMQASVAEVTRA